MSAQLALQPVIERLPSKPYVLADKGAGMVIRSLSSILKKADKPRYIQYNQPNSLAFMVFDIDYPKAILAHEFADVLQPSFYTVDKYKTTAHAVYVLENPVHRNHDSLKGPQDLFAALEQAYGEKLKADPGYSGLVMKTPWYRDHNIYYPEEAFTLCSLTEMAEYVELKQKPASYTKKRIAELADAYSESRNVAVFNLARKEAYKAYRQFFDAPFEVWHQHVIQIVEGIWTSISPNFSSEGHQYLMSERKATAKSIAKYCQNHLSQQGWQTYVEMTHLPHTQAKRGVASGQARLALSADKREQAIQLKAGGMTVREIGEMLDVSHTTVVRWLKSYQDQR